MNRDQVIQALEAFITAMKAGGVDDMTDYTHEAIIVSLERALEIAEDNEE